jgi:hypothetical protein
VTAACSASGPAFSHMISGNPEAGMSVRCPRGCHCSLVSSLCDHEITFAQLSLWSQPLDNGHLILPRRPGRAQPWSNCLWNFRNFGLKVGSDWSLFSGKRSASRANGCEGRQNSLHSIRISLTAEAPQVALGAGYYDRRAVPIPLQRRLSIP